MTDKKTINVFLWSISIFALFVVVQMAVILPLALIGIQLSPYVGFFTWFAVSAGVGWGMFRKYDLSATQIFLIQALAAFYMLALSFSVALKSDFDMSTMVALRTISVVAVLYVSGIAGLYFSKHMRTRIPSLV